MWFYNSNCGHKCGFTIPHVRDLHKVLTSNDVSMLLRISVKYVLVMFARSFAITMKRQKRPIFGFGQFCQLTTCHPPSEWSPQNADLKRRKWCVWPVHSVHARVCFMCFASRSSIQYFNQCCHVIISHPNTKKMLTSKVGSGVFARVCFICFA